MSSQRLFEFENDSVGVTKVHEFDLFNPGRSFIKELYILTLFHGDTKIVDELDALAAAR